MITSKRLIKNSQEFSSEIAFSIKDKIDQIRYKLKLKDNKKK